MLRSRHPVHHRQPGHSNGLVVAQGQKWELRAAKIELTGPADATYPLQKKGHTLEFLREMALDRKFVCSQLYISKETPLHDPVKLFQSAAEHCPNNSIERRSAVAELKKLDRPGSADTSP